mgnify:CR=1 FL=1
MPENSSSNKRIAQNTILLYMRMIFLMIVGLYTSRVVLRELGVDDYGIYNVVGGVVAMFSLLSGSMTTAISRFITFELGRGDKAKLTSIFSSSITVQLILSGIILLIAETVGLWFLNNKMVIPADRMTAANWCYQLSLITFVVNLVSVPYNATIIAHERMSAFAYISIFEGLGKLGIAFLIVWSPFDKLIYYAILIALLAILVRFIYGRYCKKNFEEAHYNFKFDKEVVGPIFSFAGWNLFGAGSNVLRNQGVDILLNMYFGVAVNAAKGLCNQVQSAVYQFVTNFQMAINPQLTIAIAQKDYHRNHSLVIQGSRFSFYLLSLFSIPFIIETDGILGLWLGDVPQYSSEFVRWTFIYLQFDCLSRFMINSVLAYGRIRNYQIVVGVAKLLVFPIAWLVLYLGGSPVTGVIVNVGIEICCIGIRLFFNKRYTQLPVIKFVKEAIIHCWMVFLIILGVAFLIKHFISPNYIIGIVVCLILSPVGIWILGLNGSERRLLIEKALVLTAKFKKR